MSGFDFSGKTVWVTGAGKGIGYATALAFVDAGAQVTGFDLAFPQDDYPFATETLDVANAAQVSDVCGRVLASLDNLMSINNAVEVDIFGQVCSETSGYKHISGSGGQLDFVTGAFRAKNGLAFLAMTSTFADKAGAVHSRILPHFTEGDIITTPRTQAPYMVTEYGVANLTGLPTWQRAEALIGLAHPDFRDELIRAAEAQRIWRKSNKR